MKNKISLIVAVVFGVAALLTTRSFVKRTEARAEAESRGKQVVAARMEIPAGTELRPEMLGLVEVPQRIVLRQAYSSAEINQLVGRRTLARLQAGQPVLATDIAVEEHGGLSTIIPPKDGEGAYTVSIAKGIKPGLIQPSDHIDIFATFALPKSAETPVSTAASWRAAGDMVNVVLLQNVTVLNVGDCFAGGRGESGAGATDLTLALTLEEAQTLMFASQQGELGALLRRDGATEIKNRTALPRITFESIEKIIGDLDDKRGSRTIEGQKGGRTVPYKVANAASARVQ